MKNKFLAFMLVVSYSLFLTNCSKSNNSPTNGAVGAMGMCPTAGYVYTTQGCLPPSSSCGMNYGYLNGSCYPAATNTGMSSCGTPGYVQTTMGCLPQGNCQPGQGYANNQCYPATMGNGMNGGMNGGTCQAGYVGTTMGCLPQGTCPANYGYYYGQYNGQTGGWCYSRTY